MTNENNTKTEIMRLLVTAFKALIEHTDFTYIGEEHTVRMNYKGPSGFKVSLDTSFVPVIDAPEDEE